MYQIAYEMRSRFSHYARGLRLSKLLTASHSSQRGSWDQYATTFATSTSHYSHNTQSTEDHFQCFTLSLYLGNRKGLLDTQDSPRISDSLSVGYWSLLQAQKIHSKYRVPASQQTYVRALTLGQIERQNVVFAVLLFAVCQDHRSLSWCFVGEA